MNEQLQDGSKTRTEDRNGSPAIIKAMGISLYNDFLCSSCFWGAEILMFLWAKLLRFKKILLGTLFIDSADYYQQTK